MNGLKKMTTVQGHVSISGGVAALPDGTCVDLELVWEQVRDMACDILRHSRGELSDAEYVDLINRAEGVV